jgi:glycosyltransferase involved in cell wall biosynthesis
VSRVVMIAYTRYYSDARVRRHAETLARRGDRVDVIAIADKAGDLNGVNVVPVSMPRYRGSSHLRYAQIYLSFFARAAAKAFGLAFANGGYDLAIVSTMPDAIVFVVLPLKLHGTRIVLDVHDTMPELYREKFGGRRGSIGARLLMVEERLSAWLADRVLAVHEPHRARLATAKVAPHKISVVMNSPDPEIFRCLPNREPAGFTMAWYGTIARRMGLDVGINAVNLLRDKISELKLLVVGEGDDTDSVKAQVERLKLQDRVIFTGMVPVDQLPSVLSQVSIGLVLNRPSAATHLMLPVKLLEFAMLGIPVAVPRLRTIEHYFPDGSVRYYIPGDPADLARAIEELYRAPQLRHRLAENALEAMRSIAWEKQRREYLRSIDSLLPQISSNGNVPACTEGYATNLRPPATVERATFKICRPWRRRRKR